MSARWLSLLFELLIYSFRKRRGTGSDLILFLFPGPTGDPGCNHW
jgi:hypothetical protein